MKKKQVVLWMSIVLLLLSSPVYSQIKLGFQLGTNFTSVNYSWSPHYYVIDISKTYLFGGILAEFKISDMFYIQPEINFLPKREAYKLKPYWTDFISSYIEGTRNYYEVTTNVLYKFDIDNFIPFLFVGPSLSFLSEAKAKYDTFETDDSHLLEKTDFSINLGGGVEIPLSKSIDLFVIAKYSLGITDTLKDNDAEYNT